MPSSSPTWSGGRNGSSESLRSQSVSRRNRRGKSTAAFFRKGRKRDLSEPEVDPRIAERARKVRDKEERKAFKRAILLLLAMTLVGIVVWLAYSPYLAVRHLVITGVVSSSVPRQLQTAAVTEGVPMISIEEELLRERLLEDPWVVNVEVEKRWPHTIRVIVEERSPVAWVRTVGGWQALSSDGVALEVDPEMAMPQVTGLGGAVLDLPHPSLEPSLRFLEYLRADLHLGTVVEIHGAQVTANVARRVVRLGRAGDIEEKAQVLGVLIDDYTDPGTVINLFSAQRPAVYRGIDPVPTDVSPSS